MYVFNPVDYKSRTPPIHRMLPSCVILKLVSFDLEGPVGRAYDQHGGTVVFFSLSNVSDIRYGKKRSISWFCLRLVARGAIYSPPQRKQF